MNLKKNEEKRAELRNIVNKYPELPMSAVNQCLEILNTPEYKIKSLKAENKRYKEVILWALGEREEFPAREGKDGPYWWRKELRKKAEF